MRTATELSVGVASDRMEPAAEPSLQSTLERLYSSLSNSNAGMNAIDGALDGPRPEPGNGHPQAGPPPTVFSLLGACLGKAELLNKQVQSLHGRIVG